MAEPLKLVIAGAGGRMGRMLMATVAVHPACALHAAFDQPSAPCIGETIHGVTIGGDVARALEGADGLLDFTAPEATLAFAHETAAREMIHIIGTTGFSNEQTRELKEISKGARVVKAGNFSLGINLLSVLTKQVAQTLGPDYDIEISDIHHRHKVDAPSGTALMLGEAAAEGRGVDLASSSVQGRDVSAEPRKDGAIGFSSVRTGEVIGEHTVIFEGATERLELKHIASDRALFADGAIHAALWARDQPPGFYSMMDVLKL